MRSLRSHGITNNKELMQTRAKNEIWNYQQIELGFNYRITDIQAALGLCQMTRLDKFVCRRHEIARYYNNALKILPITVPWQRPECIQAITFIQSGFVNIRARKNSNRYTMSSGKWGCCKRALHSSSSAAFLRKQRL